MAEDLDTFLAKQRDLPGKLGKLVEELFPGEADKQHAWLADATGKERKTLAPVVPIAEVPAVEESVRVLPPEDLDEEEEEEVAPASEAPLAKPESNASVILYAVIGAVAGLVAIGVWIALMRH